MAGMLAGVECARRRRFHQSGGYLDSPTSAGGGGGGGGGGGNHHGWTRRSSFCLYTSNHETHLSSTSSLLKRSSSALNQANQDEKLGGVVREAKERLDERLRTQRNSDYKRSNGKESSRTVVVDGGSTTVQGENFYTEVYGLKKSGSKRFMNWAKLSSWKASDQDECAVCLERFKVGETLVHLPCAHRFHSRCLVPWLETNAHCPCCRMGLNFSLSF